MYGSRVFCQFIIGRFQYEFSHDFTSILCVYRFRSVKNALHKLQRFCAQTSLFINRFQCAQKRINRYIHSLSWLSSERPLLIERLKWPMSIKIRCIHADQKRIEIDDRRLISYGRKSMLPWIAQRVRIKLTRNAMGSVHVVYFIFVTVTIHHLSNTNP